MNNTRHLSKLMVFAAVANKGSFTRAAKALGVTKSAVSQQLSQLEHELGAMLLHRTTRGVSTTALGEQLLQRCRSLQDQVDLLFDDIANAGMSPRGRFGVTYPHSLEAAVVVPAIEQLCIEYPHLEPTLVANDHNMDLVEHDLDMAIHAGELADSTYRALPVGTMTEIFCASPLYLSRAESTDSGSLEQVEDLWRHRWIATSWQREDMPIHHDATPLSSIAKLHCFARVNSLPTALAMALRHLGLVLLPDVVAQPLLNTGVLVRLLPGITGPRWPVYSVHAYQQDKPQYLVRFHQLVQQSFGMLKYS